MATLLSRAHALNIETRQLNQSNFRGKERSIHYYFVQQAADSYSIYKLTNIIYKN